jgi:hypothetical protein
MQTPLQDTEKPENENNEPIVKAKRVRKPMSEEQRQRYSENMKKVNQARIAAAKERTEALLEVKAQRLAAKMERIEDKKKKVASLPGPSAPPEELSAPEAPKAPQRQNAKRFNEKHLKKVIVQSSSDSDDYYDEGSTTEEEEEVIYVAKKSKKPTITKAKPVKVAKQREPEIQPPPQPPKTIIKFF